MIGVEAVITLAVLFAMFVALARELLSPDLVVFAALVILWGGGIIDTPQATSGFSNPQVLTIAGLFIVSAAMKETGALYWVSQTMLGRYRGPRRALARLIVPTATLSAFVNNTPIVAMFTPAIRDWAKRHDIDAQRFLIPLSYAAILGGTCTLIGTSTNLVVSGLLETSGYEPFSMFELAAVGLPATLVGSLYLLVVAPRMFPEREDESDRADDDARKYSVVLEVAPDCPLVGKSIQDAGLRHLGGLFLVEIERGEHRIVPVRPTDVIEPLDRLTLFGIADTVVELQKTPGLHPVSETGDAERDLREDRRLFEVVVSETSPLVGSTLRDANFRRRYDAAVIAIHRGGERLEEKLGDVELRAGDTLMIEAAQGFRNTWANAPDFYLVARIQESQRPRFPLARLATVTLVAMVAAIATGVVTPALAVATAVVVLVVTGCIRPSRVRSSIDLSVLLLIASSFGLSAAVEQSGLAAMVAEAVRVTFGDTGPVISLAIIYAMCALLTELLSNNAAAALMVPIATTTAVAMGYDPRPFAIAVAIAASMSFATPLGYQTNLIVYGAGGYRFSDFLRAGLPLALLIFIVANLVIALVWL